MQKYSYSILLGLLSLVSLYLLQDFILPVLMGGIGAIVLYRPTRILNRHIKNYKLAALCTGLLGTGAILLPLGFVLLSGTSELVTFLQAGEIIPQVVQGLSKVSPWLQKLAPFIPPSQIQEYSALFISFLNTKTLSVLQGLLVHFPTLLMELIITLVSTYSFLAAGPHLKQVIAKRSFLSELQTEKVHQAVINITYSVVVASILSGLLQGLFMGIITSIILPQKILLVSILVFFCSFIPIINTFPVTGSLFIWALNTTSVVPVILVLVGIVLLFVVEVLFRPWIIGSKANMHPLVAFLAALGGLSSLGFYGLFLGPIIVGVLLNLLDRNQDSIT